MIREMKLSEQRRASRTRKSDAMFWRPGRENAFEMGWLLETSDTGLAFAWRGSKPPRVGATIDVQVCGGEDTTPQRAVVRRVNAAYDDLSVIGAEVVQSGGLPLSARAIRIRNLAATRVGPIDWSDQMLAG